MNTYRNEQGIMILKFNPKTTNWIMNNCSGKIVVKNFKSGGKVNCFIMTDDQVMETPLGNLYLWKDSYIEL